MIPPSYTGGLAHEVQCVEVERDMLRKDNQELRKVGAEMRQDLRAFGLDINMRCARIAELEKQVDALQTRCDILDSRNGRRI